MDTWTYLDRSLKLEENGLGDEDLASLCAQETDFSLEQLDLLAGATAADLQKSVDYGVQINIMLICHCECVGRRKLAWAWLRRGGEGDAPEGVGCAAVGRDFTQSGRSEN